MERWIEIEERKRRGEKMYYSNEGSLSKGGLDTRSDRGDMKRDRCGSRDRDRDVCGSS